MNKQIDEILKYYGVPITYNAWANDTYGNWSLWVSDGRASANASYLYSMMGYVYGGESFWHAPAYAKRTIASCRYARKLTIPTMTLAASYNAGAHAVANFSITLFDCITISNGGISAILKSGSTQTLASYDARAIAGGSRTFSIEYTPTSVYINLDGTKYGGTFSGALNLASDNLYFQSSTGYTNPDSRDAAVGSHLYAPGTITIIR